MDEETTWVPYHVPQQSRRHKLRYHPQNDDVIPPFLSPLQLQLPIISSSPPDPLMAAASTNLSLSSASPNLRAYHPSPVGPFTGYASILARSRFLRPAQELLEDFSRANGVSFNKGLRILEDSRTLFCDDDEDDDDDGEGLFRRCTNPNLVSMLHEVYKRYKVYCQQMQSAVTSFESVAGLGNAAPFLCFAVKAMFRHFQCLKKAILDHIRVTSKVFGSADSRRERTSGSCSEDKGPTSNFIQHPLWRSQRGFPDKAVSVLKNWLYEHFLHPYPTDSDKQMLSQKTGLSRSQVSNWFTNARVRLWKPMVEEMHALERKTEGSKASGDAQKLVNLSNDRSQTSTHPQHSEKEFQIMHSQRDHQDNSRYKRSRVEAFPRVEQGREQFDMICNRLPSNQQLLEIGGSQNEPHISLSSGFGRNQENTNGLPWSSSHGQIVPFWLAKQ